MIESFVPEEGELNFDIEFQGLYRNLLGITLAVSI